VWAQVVYAFESEWARSVDDVTRRRTTLAMRGLLTDAIRDRIAKLVPDFARQRVGAT
jgi:glycerol-3-phosphate dehydrogenase